MRKITLFVLCMLAFASVSWADTPAFVNEASFPVFNKPLTAAEQAHLGLSARTLTEPLEVLNRRGPSDYRFDRLEPGDVVLEDQSGTPRYKASCGNRIEVLPVKVTVIEPSPAPRVAETPPNEKGPDWAGFFRTLGALLLTALLIACALAIVLWAFNLSRRRNPSPAPAPTPTVGPTPHVTPLVAPGPVSPAPSITPIPVPVTVPPAATTAPSSLTRHTHPMYLWTVRNGSVEWDTALVACTIESGFGLDGNPTLEVRLTARPTTTTP